VSKKNTYLNSTPQMLSFKAHLPLCFWPMQAKTEPAIGYLKYHKLDDVTQRTEGLKIHAANFRLFHFV